MIVSSWPCHAATTSSLTPAAPSAVTLLWQALCEVTTGPPPVWPCVRPMSDQRSRRCGVPFSSTARNPDPMCSNPSAAPLLRSESRDQRHHVTAVAHSRRQPRSLAGPRVRACLIAPPQKGHSVSEPICLARQVYRGREEPIEPCPASACSYQQAEVGGNKKAGSTWSATCTGP